MLLGTQRWQSPTEALPAAKQAVRKALELDDKNCEAHVVLARLSWQYDWDWQVAEKEYLRTVELCPSLSWAHAEYGIHAVTNGRIAEARARMVKAHELDPIQSEPFVGEAVIHYQLRDYKALLETARAFAVQNSNDWTAHHWIGVGYQGTGQTAQAIVAYQKACRTIARGFRYRCRVGARVCGHWQEGRGAENPQGMAAPVGVHLCFTLYDCNGLCRIGRQRQGFRVPGKSASGTMPGPYVLFEG